MDQKQRDRLDQEYPANTEGDITRSQNRQGASEDNVKHGVSGTAAQDTGSRPSNSTRNDSSSSASTSQTSADDLSETGGHAEGQYPKQGQGGAIGGQMAREDQGGAQQGQVGKPGDKPE